MPNSLPLASDPASRATAIGLSAILLWAALALLTSFAGALPPFEMLTVTFGIAFATSLVGLSFGGRQAFASWKQPLAAWISAFLGIFLFHALYFYALQHAPAAQASLIVYLWPLLIVLFSALADRRKLGFTQISGALAGFGGTGLILFARQGDDSVIGSVTGYAAAFGCALVWSLYSVVNRRFQNAPSGFIGGVCGLVAMAGALCHWLWEQDAGVTESQGLALLALGVGPVGLAFFAWDHATKRGRMALLGALSYLSPLLSTLLLILTGMARFQWAIVAAALLIVAGAVLAARRTRA